MPVRVYLDNCAFNRPFDDPRIARNQIESDAKLQIQDLIRDGQLELVWSYILDLECGQNPIPERRLRIEAWKPLCVEDISASEDIHLKANHFQTFGLRIKDSLHIACAIAGSCQYFVTTDDKILNKVPFIRDITLINPLDFILL